jgi:hypothetical protein
MSAKYKKYGSGATLDTLAKKKSKFAKIWKFASISVRYRTTIFPKILFASILRQYKEQGGKDTVSGWKPVYLTNRGDKVLPQKTLQKTFGKFAKC